MYKLGLFRAIWVALLLCGVSVTASEASTITIDFSTGPAGPVIPQTFTDGSGLTVDAWYLTGGVWTQTDLFRRIETPDDLGFGVCSPGESCGTGLGGGDYNELSNLSNAELIRLTLPLGYQWVSVDISSADTNGSTDSASYERGQLWTSTSGSPSTTPGALFGGSPLWQITGGSPNQTFSGFTTSNNQSAFLFFEAYDWFGNGANTNNDYLVRSVTLVEPEQVTQVPEPATLTLLGSGLVLWRARRRRPSD